MSQDSTGVDSKKKSFFKLLKEDGVLLGITNSTAMMSLNGKSSFMKGIVENPSVDDVVDEMEKILILAKQLSCCDLAIFWPLQYICTGERSVKITEKRKLPLLKIAEICGRLEIYFPFIYCEGHIELNRNLVKELQRRSRGRFLGECLGEVGGRTWYGEKRVKNNQRAQNKAKAGFIRYKWYAKDMQEAKDNYVDYIRCRVTKYKDMGCPLSLIIWAKVRYICF